MATAVPGYNPPLSTGGSSVTRIGIPALVSAQQDLAWTGLAGNTVKAVKITGYGKAGAGGGNVTIQLNAAASTYSAQVVDNGVVSQNTARAWNTTANCPHMFEVTVFLASMSAALGERGGFGTAIQTTNSNWRADFTFSLPTDYTSEITSITLHGSTASTFGTGFTAVLEYIDFSST